MIMNRVSSNLKIMLMVRGFMFQGIWDMPENMR